MIMCVATNVKKDDGSRAIGTIPARSQNIGRGPERTRAGPIEIGHLATYTPYVALVLDHTHSNARH